jgi:glycosyl transferase family 25
MVLNNKEIYYVIFGILIIVGFSYCKKKFIQENFVDTKVPNIITYVINLDESPDRLKYIGNQLSAANIDFIRFKAINGKGLNLEKIYADGLVTAKWLKRGQVGVALSHITLWKTIKNWEEDIAIVLEDDAIIPKNFWVRLKICINQLPDNWDMLFLGGTSIIGKKFSTNLLTPTTMATKGIYNTGFFAYMVNKKSLKTLIKKSKPLITAIDNQIKDEAFKDLNVYYAYPPIISHNYNFKSDNNRINENKEYSITNKFLMKAKKIILM